MQIRIPITLPTQRTDGTALAATEIATINMFMSADGGQNYVDIGHAAADQDHFDQELTDPGTYLFRAEVVDTQVPPRTSDDSAPVSFTLAAPALAAPSPPVLGTPTEI